MREVLMGSTNDSGTVVCRGRVRGASESGATRRTHCASSAAAATSTSRRVGAAPAATPPAGSANVTPPLPGSVPFPPVSLRRDNWSVKAIRRKTTRCASCVQGALEKGGLAISSNGSDPPPLRPLPLPTLSFLLSRSPLSLSSSLSHATFGGVAVAAPLLPPLLCVVEEVATVVIVAAAAALRRHAAAVSIASSPLPGSSQRPACEGDMDWSWMDLPRSVVGYYDGV
ncbi:hypothetical protein Taro_037428 [Colocasia esculenta]|uniref:Uncharacterized protein n=1 Tax=Colocasia esculenta TaxID=4460 RepID=A0A843W451_COLES|nr:hypothetical protein [Colocasia esculenta]